MNEITMKDLADKYDKPKKFDCTRGNGKRFTVDTADKKKTATRRRIEDIHAENARNREYEL